MAKCIILFNKTGVKKAIVGSSNFTVNGLGLGGSPNIELNMVVDSDRDRMDLKMVGNVVCISATIKNE